MHNSSAAIYLSRHCKTAWNVEGRLQGTIDLPLAEVGVKQTIANVAVIRDLGVRRIVCSTARRAYETARLYTDSLGLPIHNTPGLRELDHGKWEGRKTEEVLLDPDDGPSLIPLSLLQRPSEHDPLDLSKAKHRSFIPPPL